MDRQDFLAGKASRLLSSKLSSSRAWRVLCRNCDQLLYSYNKQGKGNLIKCYPQRIQQDNTNEVCKCPCCANKFCIVRPVKGKLAHKLIQDRIKIIRSSHGGR